ncbi:GNAT family N-acetyltransferase [Metabacillus litoralis]|uniref:GNAT family N-acetyltransferase n=1 Tax=Metabacillus litoralis TaxID=152268 RepID=UPI001CFEAEA8|nr:GNAT family N-acetyltransferase [Metabacillus litoralis]
MKEIILLSAEHAELYRTIRLEALKNNPEAFASSYEEEVELDMINFKNRLHSSHSYTFGACSEKQLVGTVTLVHESKSKLQHRATIYAMYVSLEYRGIGFARALMQRAITHAKNLSIIEQIYLTVVTENQPAKNLYQSLGFQVYAEERNALKIQDTYYDEQHMVCYLNKPLN